MNATERTMTSLLAEGRERYGYVAVKAEFEAEGTRFDELLRLVEIAHRAGVDLTVKIGGCEAIRDLLDVKQVGVRYVVAPMVESPYALSKFIAAKNSIYDDDEQRDVEFLFNLETITADRDAAEILAVGAAPAGVNGVVFGRVDYVGSLGADRLNIDDDAITERVIHVSRLCKEAGLDLVVGGAVTRHSIRPLRAIREMHLSRFETRKVVFSADALDMDDTEAGLLNAVRFELLWLRNKRDYYGTIEREDHARIEMLESRIGGD